MALPDEFHPPQYRLLGSLRRSRFMVKTKLGKNGKDRFSTNFFAFINDDYDVIIFPVHVCDKNKNNNNEEVSFCVIEMERRTLNVATVLWKFSADNTFSNILAFLVSHLWVADNYFLVLI